jgi:hypothetical protein
VGSLDSVILECKCESISNSLAEKYSSLFGTPTVASAIGFTAFLALIAACFADFSCLGSSRRCLLEYSYRLTVIAKAVSFLNRYSFLI